MEAALELDRLRSAVEKHCPNKRAWSATCECGSHYLLSPGSKLHKGTLGRLQYFRWKAQQEWNGGYHAEVQQSVSSHTAWSEQQDTERRYESVIPILARLA